MGWQDRDYARPTGSYRTGPFARTVQGGGGRSVVTVLIVVNVAIFMLCSMTSGQGHLSGSPIFQWTAMHTPSVLHGEVWRIITSDYLHWGFGHLFMNMLGLHFLGRSLERDWGPKRFFAIYSIAGILGSVFYLALTMVGWLHVDGVAAGASGCVLGLLGACAVRYPQAEVLIYFLFPIKIRTAALLFGGWYVFNLLQKGANAGGDACHLAGMAFGAWWAWKGGVWWAGRSSGIRRPQKVRRAAATESFTGGVAQRRVDAETVDRILRKVYEGGIHNLSEGEKTALREATDRQKVRDAQADRL